MTEFSVSLLDSHTGHKVFSLPKLYGKLSNRYFGCKGCKITAGIIIVTMTGIVAITVIMVEYTAIEANAVAREVKEAFIPESGKEMIPGKFSGDHLFCGQKESIRIF